MKWLNKLERKIGNFYIKNLMLIIICGNILVYAMTVLRNDYSLRSILSLNPTMIMQGQIWRLLTFIFVPENTSPIFFILSMYFYYLAGTGLEHEWGEFKFNIYYLVGMIATICVSMITGIGATGTFINLSLFLAFARIYPNFQLLLFFIIPIKVKYIAMLNWILIAWSLITSTSIGGALLTLVPLLNYFLFFGKDIAIGTKDGAVNYRRKQKYREQVREREIFHKCEVCGITEKDDPKMDFRYCSKCSGKKCYCENHIRNHEHK